MKKFLSVLLITTMFFSSIGLVSMAAGEGEPAVSFIITDSCTIPAEADVTKELFSITANIDSSKIAALDGESKAYTYEVVAVVADGVDYLKDEDAFFEIFKAEDFSGTDLEVTLKFDFESAKVFGTLNYKIIIFGFMAPSFSVGLGPIDDALSNITLPTEIAIEGSVWQFPSVDSFEVTKKPVKQDYLDSEKFDLDGTSLNVHTKVATGYTEELDPVTGETVITYEYKPGYSGKIEYSPETANMFTCNPSKDEKLNVNATEVIAYFDGFEIAKLPVNVKHDLPDPADEENHFVSITTDLYTDAKPGYHAIVCDGCGEAHNAQPHIPSPVLDENGQPLVDEEGEIICWTSNNDQTFLKNGTESSICQDCGAVLTRNTFGTADYNDTLANYHFIRVILDYINMLLSIINGAL